MVAVFAHLNEQLWLSVVLFQFLILISQFLITLDVVVVGSLICFEQIG